MKNQEPFTKLYVDQLRDLYHAEKQLTHALPKMVRAASSENLKQAFADHLEETNDQVDRLKEIFDELQLKPEGKKCAAMEGLIQEGKEVMESKEYGPEVTDAGLIATAQRVEHYEMAAYGTARYFAKLLGFHKAADLLLESEKEEKHADIILNHLAKSEINPGALASQNAAAKSPENAEHAHVRGNSSAGNVGRSQNN